MLTWLGIRRSKKAAPSSQFFEGQGKSRQILVLLSSIVVFFILRGLFYFLIPENYLADSFVSIVPSLLAWLASIIWVVVWERAGLKKR